MSDAPDLEGFAEANRPIVEALRSEDRELHEEVLDSLAYLLDDELAEEVVRILRVEGPEGFRAELALALGPTLDLQRTMHGATASPEGDLPDGTATDSPESVDEDSFLSSEGVALLVRSLESVFRDGAVPGAVRRAVLEASVRDPQPWHEGAVRAAWASEDLGWKLTALFCMGVLVEWEFSKEVIEGSRSPYPEVRREAIVAAGRRRMQALFPDLARLVANHEADEELRTAAVSAVATIGGPGALEVVQAAVGSGRPELAEVALEASRSLLARQGGEVDDLADVESYEELMKRLAEDAGPEIS